MSISPFNLPRRDNWGPITAAFPGVGGGVTLVSPYTVSSLDLETGKRSVVAYVATQCGDRTKHVRDATSASLLGTPVVVLVRMDATMLAVHLHGKYLVEPYHLPGREPADLPKTIASNDTELFVMTSPFTVLYQVALKTNQPLRRFKWPQIHVDLICAGPSLLATRAVVGPSVTVTGFRSARDMFLRRRDYHQWLYDQGIIVGTYLVTPLGLGGLLCIDLRTDAVARFNVQGITNAPVFPVMVDKQMYAVADTGLSSWYAQPVCHPAMCNNPRTFQCTTTQWTWLSSTKRIEIYATLASRYRAELRLPELPIEMWHHICSFL
tara:strand:+ start:1243 stop:2208 length:966 start_codon:yes stop_codon:yes gene_type:complete